MTSAELADPRGVLQVAWDLLWYLVTNLPLVLWVVLMLALALWAFVPRPQPDEAAGPQV